ncbi:MAG: sugar ABC transporter permease [Pandoraea sp.]|nr:sugar ABC transporter permease [Pandoraea sp.]MDR3398013.1 sugar ABC transporter permease [Pandoraea sp.]
MTDLPLSHAVAAPPPRARTWRVHRIAPWLYILPATATFLIWVYEPLGRAVWLSFVDWNMLPTSEKTFVGWENYRNILGLDQLWQATANTGLSIVGLLPIAVALPLAIAIYTEDLPRRARHLYRALIFVPMIIAPVVAATVWRWLLDPGHGIVNLGLQALGFSPIDFLNDPRCALWTIIGITGWKLMGFSTLIFTAANANINPSLIEAARMDGATHWAIVRDIRLPLLSSNVLFLTMMTILLGAQWSFAYINVLTQGGPLGATTNLYYLLWDFGFSSLSVGWASASAVLLFAMFGTIAFVLLRMIDRYSFHDN